MPTTSEIKVHDQIRAARREAYRVAILDAARSLFEAQGFRAITMADIARAAGVAKGTLYNYFDSKEEVFAELAQRGRREFLESFEAALSGKSGWDELTAAVTFTLEFLVRNAAMVHVYFEATGGVEDTAADPHGSEGQRAYATRLATIFAGLERDGQLRSDFTPDFLVASVSGLVESTSRLLKPENLHELPSRVEALMNLFRRGIEA